MVLIRKVGGFIGKTVNSINVPQSCRRWGSGGLGRSFAGNKLWFRHNSKQALVETVELRLTYAAAKSGAQSRHYAKQ